MVRRAWALLLLLATPLLAGCTDDPPTPAATLPEGLTPPKTQTPPIPLPEVRLGTHIEGDDVDLQITVQGDPRGISHHEIDWGDGDGLRPREGAPPARYTHDYPQPRRWSEPPLPYTITLTLTNAQGQTRSTSTAIEIQPPPNRAPVATLQTENADTDIPARITFHISSTDPDGTIIAWRLDTGDAQPPILGDGVPPATIEHTYRRIGNHTVRLTLTDDGGTKGNTTLQLATRPPNDREIWTLSPTNLTAYHHDANGRVLGARSLALGCTDTCPTLVGAAQARGSLVVLMDAGAKAYAHIIDGRDGILEQTLELPGQPHAIQAAPDGRLWTLHRDGNITWFRPGDTTIRTTRLAANDNDLAVAFGSDGVAWILVNDTVSRLHRIDPIEGRAGPIALPIPAAAQHLAVNTKHNIVVVLDEQARSWVAGSTVWGPRLLRVDALGEDATARDVLCPAGTDHCWAALGGARPGLVGVQVDRLPNDEATARRIALPDDAQPVRVTNAWKHLVVSTTEGLHIIRRDTGEIEHEIPLQSTAPQRFETHAAHPTLLYHDGGDTLRWQILDVQAGLIVHRATAAGGILGPYPVEASDR